MPFILILFQQAQIFSLSDIKETPLILLQSPSQMILSKSFCLPLSITISVEVVNGKNAIKNINESVIIFLRPVSDINRLIFFKNVNMNIIYFNVNKNAFPNHWQLLGLNLIIKCGVLTSYHNSNDYKKILNHDTVFWINIWWNSFE